MMIFLSLNGFVYAQKVKTAANDTTFIRDIMDQYYDGKFYVGAASRKTYFTSPDSNSVRFFNEFSYNTPENSFKQSNILATSDASWNDKEYLYFIKKARETKQVIRAHSPISPQASAWVKDDQRTAKELDNMLKDFMTDISKDLEDNKDVVKWMDVVNETLNPNNTKGLNYNATGGEDTVLFERGSWMGPKKGTTSWENPWTVMGFDTVKVNNEPFVMPKYIKKSFVIANKHAPHIKKIWNTHGKTYDLIGFEKQKKAITYLRSQGLAVDGIGWQAHVKLGWEKDPKNIKELESVIDWCYQNNLEFHVTELDVQVAASKDLNALKTSRAEQAQTLNAVVEVLLKKIGKGAVGVNFWTKYDHYGDGSTVASLFDVKGMPNPAYYKLKELLIKYGHK